jgi:hypothetical protein
MVFLSVSWVVLAITGRVARWVDTAKPASAHEARPKITKRVGIICLYIVCPHHYRWVGGNGTLSPCVTGRGAPAAIR